MPTPDFIVELRRHVGHAPLFLIGVTSLVFREVEATHGNRSGRQLLMVRRADTGAWTPIAGIVEPGEQLHEVAVREVREETSVIARVERMIWVKTYPLMTYTNGDQASYVNHTFVLRHVSGEATVGDDESIATGWFDVTALPSMGAHFRERVDYALGDPTGIRYGDGPVLPDSDAAAPARPDEP